MYGGYGQPPYGFGGEAYNGGCGDGYDNDCDDITDCDDDDCRFGPPCCVEPREPDMCDPPYTYWDTCQGCCVNSGGNCQSPILIDIEGDGFDLTDASNGVNFELDLVGRKERLAWTSIDSDDVWLVLDRNGNGKIDDGSELFGSMTPQPDPPPGQQRNGFLALAEFDRVENGGNVDGKITAEDTIFDHLRLWRDRDHNGRSRNSELFRLHELGLRRLDLDYRGSRRMDEYGNQFRWRAKVRDANDAQLGRWAWDVVLRTQ
jgi:hypothetical protein